MPSVASGGARRCSSLVGRAELLAAESQAYHGPGTCTFYGTANSNQMMMELMGLHIPNAAFINPGTPLRQALTRAAVHRLAVQVGVLACGRLASGRRRRPGYRGAGPARPPRRWRRPRC